jgi:hypothetical protein
VGNRLVREIGDPAFVTVRAVSKKTARRGATRSHLPLSQSVLPGVTAEEGASASQIVEAVLAVRGVRAALILVVLIRFLAVQPMRTPEDAGDQGHEDAADDRCWAPPAPRCGWGVRIHRFGRP